MPIYYESRLAKLALDEAERGSYSPSHAPVGASSSLVRPLTGRSMIGAGRYGIRARVN